MHRIDGAGNDAGQFRDEDVSIGQEGTVLTADWANAIQEEIVGVILASGATLNKADNTQLKTAIDAMVAGGGAGWTALPLSSGWSADTTGQSGIYVAPQYRLDAQGRVSFRGRALRASSSSNTTIAALPAGALPKTGDGFISESACAAAVTASRTRTTAYVAVIGSAIGATGYTANSLFFGGTVASSGTDIVSVDLSGIAPYWVR